MGAEGLTKEQERTLYVSILNAFSIYQSLNTVEEFPDNSEESLKIWADYFYTILEATSDSGIEEFLE